MHNSYLMYFIMRDAEFENRHTYISLKIEPITCFDIQVLKYWHNLHERQFQKGFIIQ